MIPVVWKGPWPMVNEQPMAKRKTKKRKKNSDGLFTRLRCWVTAPDWPTIRRTGIATTWLLAVIGVIVGWMFGVPQLESRVAAATIAGAEQIVDVRFANAPSWVQGDLEAMLAHTAGAHLSPNPLAHDELVNAQNALLETGCFESIQQLRRVDVTRVEVHATFLTPYAVVNGSNHNWIIDRNGRLLPASYRVSDQSHFIAIRGVRYEPPREPAQRWEGTDITAALRLIRLIESQRWAGQIDAVDITGFMQGKPMRLRTDRGSVLLWHSAPGDEAAGEVSANEKIRRIDFLFEQRGHVDGGYDNELDLADPRGVFAR